MKAMEQFEEFGSLSNIDDLGLKLLPLSEDRLYKIAKVCFDSVIASNFAGVPESIIPPLPSFITPELAKERLSFGLNSPYLKARCLPHLYLATRVASDHLDRLRHSGHELVVFRIFVLWQKVLMEPSVDLKKKIEDLISSVKVTEIERDDLIRYYLEKANSHLFYYEYELCKESIDLAATTSGLQIQMDGQLGKRTRFQQSEVSQLVLNTTSSIESDMAEDDDLPTNVILNDDTLLEQVSFTEKLPSDPSKLSPEVLAVILALGKLERRTEHNDDLLMEKCCAYWETIVSAKRCWAVQMSTLLVRSELEKTKRRRVERACMQSEAIVKLMEGVDDSTSLEKRWARCNMVLASGMETWWDAKVIHAEILRSLGCTSEALLIFESMELWDSAIDCYKSLEQLEKADALIRRLLEERPNDSMLYVYLGDIRQEVSYYEKAIEISNDGNARARKSLGQLLLFRNQYEQAYIHLRRSLELQPIQLGVWFNAGHCAWKLEKYSDSAHCYHRCVSFEPDHFEAWNNLSAAYIRQNQKDRARIILQEALKFNYEHAKVWENYMVLCVDTGVFEEAIKSFHRLLDLNKRQQDDEVLGILAEFVLKKEEEQDLSKDEKLEISNLRDDLVKLFARIVTLQTLSSKVWNLYALLKRPKGEDVTEFEKYVQLLERSVLSSSNKPDWAKDVENCISTLNSAVNLATERLHLAKLKATEDAEKQAKSRIRMSLKPLLTTAEKQHLAEGDNSNDENLKEAFENVRSTLSLVSN